MDAYVTGVYFVAVVLFIIFAVHDLYISKKFQLPFAQPVARPSGACPMSCTSFPGYGCGYLSNNVLFECPSNCCS